MKKYYLRRGFLEETSFTISTNSPVSLPSPSAAVNNLADLISELSTSSKLCLSASRSMLGSFVTFSTKSPYVEKNLLLLGSLGSPLMVYHYYNIKDIKK